MTIIKSPSDLDLGLLVLFGNGKREIGRHAK